MESLSQMASAAQIIYWGLTSVIGLLLVYRVYKIYFAKQVRYALPAQQGHVFPKVLKGLFGLSMLLLLLAFPFYVLVASSFKIYVPTYLNYLLIGVVFLVAALECRHTFTLSQKLLEKRYKKAGLSIIVGFLLPFSLYLAYYVPGMFRSPSEAESVSLELPVKGKWIAYHAGNPVFMNYHNATEPQQYAMDIMKLNANNKVYEGKGDTITDLYTMHEEVYAPAEGEVIHAIDSLANHDLSYGSQDSANPAGNHVVIEAGKEQYIFLAHLHQGSLAVQQGDQVKPGDLIGTIGNSGNTSWPHLHLHIQDKAKLNDTNAIGQPFRFKRMKRKRVWGWETLQDGYLIRNDYFQPVSN
jgi:hypothetical protein